MIGRSAFLLLTLSLGLRSAWIFLFAHERFDANLTLFSYIDVAVLSIGATHGYNAYTFHPPAILTSAIAARQADRFLLANPFEARHKK